MQSLKGLCRTRLAALSFVASSLLLATTAAAAPEGVRDSSVFWTAIVAGELVLLLGAMAFGRSIVFSLVDERLNSPKSPLADHLRDADAHERMRKAFRAEIEERIDELQAAALSDRQLAGQARDDMRAALDLAQNAVQALLRKGGGQS